MGILGESAGAGEGGAPASSGAGNSGGGNPAPNAQVTTGGSTGEKSWRDSLPDDIKSNPAISSFQDVAALAKSHIHAQSLVGKKGAIPPSDWTKATPEEKSGFFKAIGMPDPDKYQVSLPVGVEMTDAESKYYRDAFIEQGVLPHQASGIMAKHIEFQKQQEAAAKKEAASIAVKQQEDLKKEWGDGYDSKVAKANLLLKEHLPPEFTKHLVDTGLGNDVHVVRAFAALAEKFLSEDALREGGVGSGRGSPDEIRSQISEIMAKGNENGYYDKSHPMHEVTLRKVEGLYRQLTGGK